MLHKKLCFENANYWKFSLGRKGVGELEQMHVGKAKQRKQKKEISSSAYTWAETGCTLAHKGPGNRRRLRKKFAGCSHCCGLLQGAQSLCTDVMCVWSLHLNSMGRIPEAKEDALLPCNPEQCQEKNWDCTMQLKFVFIIYKSKNLHLEFPFLSHVEEILHG